MRKFHIALPTVAAGFLLTSALAFADPTTTETTETTRSTKKRVKHLQHSERKAADDPTAGKAADNTGINQRDRDTKELTADQQPNNKSDLQLTAEIRRAIMKDKTLSMNAHNIKIIVKGGDVTLKGPVASTDEKNRVETTATEIVGRNKGKVTSEVAVAP